MVKIEWLKLCQLDWANNNIYKHMLRSKYVAYHNPSFSLTTEGIEYKSRLRKNPNTSSPCLVKRKVCGNARNPQDSDLCIPTFENPVA